MFLQGSVCGHELPPLFHIYHHSPQAHPSLFNVRVFRVNEPRPHYRSSTKKFIWDK
ncbi:hypothetical protein Hanom_Chr13g01215651 [Helianthus anomalus]